MIQLIIGEKGKGKTKILLDKVNSEVKAATGNVVYLDKSKQHMYEINNKVRLIDVTDFPLDNCDAFIGFLCGIISQDHDLEKVFLDSFLKITKMEEAETIAPALEKIAQISEAFKVDFVLSISITKDKLPEKFAQYVIND